MELKITNDDFKVEILDNDKKKTINASYDIFDFDDKDIYQKEYDKIYNKLIKKYPPEKAEILAKQKLYTKGF